MKYTKRKEKGVGNVKKTKKIHELINILMNQKDYITVNELANKIDVSSRTIHNYLDSSEFSALIYQNEINKIPNVGIKITLTNNRKINVLSKIKSISYVPVTKNNYDDFTFIMIHLFTAKDYLSYSYIEKNLYKSSSGIQNIVLEIEAFVSKFSCKLVYIRNHGLKVEGSESDIRSLFLFVITNYISFADDHHQTNRLSVRTESILNTFFSQNEKENLIHLGEFCETAMNTNICENDYNLLLLYLMIIVIRLKNQFISDEKIEPKIENSMEFQYAVLLKFHMENKFQIKVPENELYYLARILMSTRKQINVITEYSENKVINRFIHLVSIRLNIDLTKDNELSRNLYTHLRPAINRMKQGIPFSNPLLDHIKNDYTEVYLSVLTTIDDLEKIENIYFDSNEIGYICLHIIAAINRPENVSSLKVALICNEGLSIELFLINLIESYFKEIEITEVYRSNSINDLQPNKYTLIINSTKAIVIASNVISIDPSFTDEDFIKIKHFITFSNIESELNKVYLDEYLTISRRKLLSQESFIKESCSYLFKNGFVTNKFTNTVFERQQKSSTYVARGIAVLHGSKEEVIQPTVMIVNLEKEIEWDGYNAKTVIFIVTNDSNSSIFSQLLRQVMRIASSDQLTERLYVCENVDDVYELLEEVK